jgi:hypothetical protein
VVAIVQLLAKKTEMTTIANKKVTCSRHCSILCINAQVRPYSQWFPGAEINVAYSLSGDTNLQEIKRSMRISGFEK